MAICKQTQDIVNENQQPPTPIPTLDLSYYVEMYMLEMRLKVLKRESEAIDSKEKQLKEAFEVSYTNCHLTHFDRL